MTSSQLTSDHLRSSDITENIHRFLQCSSKYLESLRSPGITRHCQTSPEISSDHLRSLKFTSLQLSSPQIIWYLMILPDMTWTSPEVTSDLLKSPKISTDFCSAVQNTWESLRSPVDHPTLSQITWDQLRSPEITLRSPQFSVRSPQIILILNDTTWHDLRSSQLTWGHLRSSEINENIHRFLQCSSKYLGVAWDHLGSREDCPRSLEISWDHLRSP